MHTNTLSLAVGLLLLASFPVAAEGQGPPEGKSVEVGVLRKIMAEHPS